MQEITIELSEETLRILKEEENRYKTSLSCIIERIVINHMLAKYYIKKDELGMLLDFLKSSDYNPKTLGALRSLVSKLPRKT